MSAKRQKIQLELAFTPEERGEAPRPSAGGIEATVAGRATESRAEQERTMEAVCERENLRRALKQVRRNRGRPGVDGMTVDELPGYLAAHWPQIQAQLLLGTYKPQPVRRVEIPKPGGGVRTLGIPTVLDRFIQQAVLQVLQARWDPTFSEHSYGFRPGKSAHQAVAKAQGTIAEGYGWVVDMDLEKFFDRVNHDRLMAQVAKRESDKRLLKLLRAFLEAGAMEGGLVSPTREGTPQGGPLSPLLSNLVLDELDRELTRRGHRFVRYADDCNIYVRSERAGQRVMGSISTFIIRKLKLRVNEHKSAVARPRERKFLGFRILGLRKPKRGIAPEAQRRFRQRVRERTRRRRGISLERRIGELSRYLQGWIAYFGFCETPSVLTDLDSWIRRRLRSVAWHQWKTPRRRREQLRRAGVGPELAHAGAGSSRGPWRMSKSHALHTALPNATFARLGLPSLAALAKP
jgi:RNA-directed DNA polymerase